MAGARCWCSAARCRSLLVPLLVVLLPESARLLALRGATPATHRGDLGRVTGHRFSGDEIFVSTEPPLPTQKPIGVLFSQRLWRDHGVALGDLFHGPAGDLSADRLAADMMKDAGVSIATAANVTAMFQIGGTVGAIIGRLGDGHAPVQPSSSRPLTSAAACACWLCRNSACCRSRWRVLVFAAGFCMSGAQTGLNAFAPGCYPTMARATGVSWMLGMGRFGSIFGSAVGGALLGWAGGSRRSSPCSRCRRSVRRRRSSRQRGTDAVAARPERCPGSAGTIGPRPESSRSPGRKQDARRTHHGRGPSRPSRAAHAEARGVAALLRRRHGHDRERPAGRQRLPARLGRLRALLAEAHRLAHLRPGPRGLPRPQPAGAAAPGRGAAGVRPGGRLARGRTRPRPGLPVPRSGRPPAGDLLRDRVVSGARSAAAVAEEPGAALPGPRRQRAPARPLQLPRRRHPRQPRVLRAHARLPPDRADRARRRHRGRHVADRHQQELRLRLHARGARRAAAASTT